LLFERLLEVLQLLASQQADLAQRLQVPLGVRDVAHHQVGLADVLVRAAVARIDRERALVVPECRVVLLEVAVREPQVVLQVRVVGIAHLGLREACHCRLPVALLQGLAARGVIGVVRGEVRIGLFGIGVRRRRERREGEPRQRRREPPVHCRATNAFACTTSGRAPSAPRVSSSSFA
jgi:hypothetical protein